MKKRRIIAEGDRVLFIGHEAGTKNGTVILLEQTTALVHVPVNAVGWRYELVPVGSLVRM